MRPRSYSRALRNTKKTYVNVNVKHRLGSSLFLLQNKFFGPRTAKSQPIWIKFFTHLLCVTQTVKVEVRMGAIVKNSGIS